MEFKEIIELIETIDNSELKFFELEQGELKLRLGKEMPETSINPIPVLPETVQPELTKQTITQETEVSEVSETQDDVEAPGRVVESPMIGVAYLQSAPGEPAYVQVGDRVEVGDTLLIIEAMKLMNEIKSDRAGIITEILVENESVVEYGQALVRIK